MAELNTTTDQRKIRRRGRESQTLVYLGKLFRFFIYESDWKVLPMAAIIAALVIIRHKDNIKRIHDGTESKFEKKSNDTPEAKGAK